MKTIVVTFFLLIISQVGHTQDWEQTHIDSLKRELLKTALDTNSVFLMNQLSTAYGEINTDSSKVYAEKALKTSKQIGFTRGEAAALSNLTRVFRILGDIPKALNTEFQALQVAEDNNHFFEKTECLGHLGALYMDLQDYPKARKYFTTSEDILKTHPSNNDTKLEQFYNYQDFAWLFRKINKPDSCVIYTQKAQNLSYLIKNPKDLSYFLLQVSHSQVLLKKYNDALENFRKSILISEQNHYYRTATWANSSAAECFNLLSNRDSAIFYAQKGLANAQKIDFSLGILRTANLLTALFESKDIQRAFFYQKIAIAANDEVSGANKILDLQKTLSDEQERQRNIEAERISRENRLRQYLLLAGFALMFIIGVLLYRNNRQKHKANLLLHQQKEEIQSTLSQLKSTQTQLIQSEKLASLGELTAGIAHEIQNPLNFVNNFSELSVDLAKDLNDEIHKPDIDKEYVEELLTDLTANQEKINHHGKRASSIVKGMLEHSRASTGVKELTDMNKLADEYLRLAYHGFKAKNDSFDAELKMDFDENLPKIEVIPQDMGRVLLNLINNAFYAVHQRKQDVIARNEAISSYTPSVLVTTKQLENSIEIRVKDNGTGMSESVKAKVFQPFFTTKPTGQGTGLGLSLAYDIVTKGHGGTLEVVSTEGVGSEFIITLPFKTNVQ